MHTQASIQRANPHYSNRHAVLRSMKRPTVKPVPESVSALAGLLGIPRATIARLAARERNPLPLPQRQESGIPMRVGGEYVRDLRVWVVNEQGRCDQDKPRLLTQICEGLSKIEKEEYGYDFVHAYPPCYFAG